MHAEGFSGAVATTCSACIVNALTAPPLTAAQSPCRGTVAALLASFSPRLLRLLLSRRRSLEQDKRHAGRHNSSRATATCVCRIAAPCAARVTAPVALCATFSAPQNVSRRARSTLMACAFPWPHYWHVHAQASNAPAAGELANSEPSYVLTHSLCTSDHYEARALKSGGPSCPSSPRSSSPHATVSFSRLASM